MLTCADGKWILDGVQKSNLSPAVRAGIVLEIINSMPDDCKDEQYQAGT